MKKKNEKENEEKKMAKKALEMVGRHQHRGNAE